jgi:hypothetical protein
LLSILIASLRSPVPWSCLALEALCVYLEATEQQRLVQREMKTTAIARIVTATLTRQRRRHCGWSSRADGGPVGRPCYLPWPVFDSEVIRLAFIVIIVSITHTIIVSFSEVVLDLANGVSS